MQPRKVGCIVFVWLFFFQSVANSFTLGLGIDFTERAHFNEDGSGQFSIKIDLKRLKWLTKVIGYFNKDYKGIIQSVSYKSFNNVEERLKNITDISQLCVNRNDNEKELNCTLTFRFNTIQALNKAMRKINKGLDPPKLTYFSLDDALFVRQDINGIAQKVLFYQQYDKCLIKSLDLASFFKETTYTTIYTFHSVIEGYSNPLSELTKDKKTIRIAHYIFAPDQIEESIGNRIHLATK